MRLLSLVLVPWFSHALSLSLNANEAYGENERDTGRVFGFWAHGWWVSEVWIVIVACYLTLGYYVTSYSTPSEPDE